MGQGKLHLLCKQQKCPPHGMQGLIQALGAGGGGGADFIYNCLSNERYKPLIDASRKASVVGSALPHWQLQT